MSSVARIGECDCCSFEPVEVKDYDCSSLRNRGEKNTLCALCASTAAGNTMDYPEQYAGQVATLKAICHVGNAILAKLESISQAKA